MQASRGFNVIFHSPKAVADAHYGAGISHNISWRKVNEASAAGGSYLRLMARMRSADLPLVCGGPAECSRRRLGTIAEGLVVAAGNATPRLTPNCPPVLRSGPRLGSEHQRHTKDTHVETSKMATRTGSAA